MLLTPKYPQNDLKMKCLKPCRIVYQMKDNGKVISIKEVTLIFRVIWTLQWPKITPKRPQNDFKLNFLKPCLGMYISNER